MLSLLSIVQSSLWEDAYADDVTARLLGKEGKALVRAEVRSRAEGVFAGDCILRAFEIATQGDFRFETRVKDGDKLSSGTLLFSFQGEVAKCLSLERPLLNFLTLSCGVATETSRYVEAVEGTKVTVLATRKTIPGLRELQLRAVEAGGGRVHRRSLSDGILIKDNHQAVVSGDELIRRAKATKSPLHSIEIEVQNLEQLSTALNESPDVIMLDNLPPAEMVEALKRINGRCKVEASGGVTLKTIRAIAELGVDFISVGALTHSAPALNLSLDIVPLERA